MNIIVIKKSVKLSKAVDTDRIPYNNDYTQKSLYSTKSRGYST